MSDAERVDEARQRDRAARVDRREEVLHARLAPALALFEPQLAVAALEGEDVLGRADDALVVELIDALRAEPLDVEGVARDEMLEALARLRRADQPAGAAPHRILLARARIDLAHGVAAAGRAYGREDVGLGARRALVERHLEHLRDHVAGALHHDGVADTDVDAAADRLAVAADALDVVLVVQRRVLRRRRRRRSRGGASRPGSASRCGRHRSGCPPGPSSPSGPETCGRAPSAASARRSRGAAAGRGRRPCRRRRRCRSRDPSASASISRWKASISSRLATRRISGLTLNPQRPNAATTSDCVPPGNALISPQV